jgi:hypothetical protein
VVGLAVVMADQFLDPSKGPDQSGGFQVSPTYFIVLFFAGFLIGGAGHLWQSKTLVAIGVLFVMLATLFIPLALAITR